MLNRVILAAVIASFSALTVGAQSAADSSCVYPFSKGSGYEHISWCVSTGGNIVRLESPAFSDNIGTTGTFMEGVLVCQFFVPGRSPELAYDNGVDQAGFSGAPSLASVAPLTIDRTIVNPADGASAMLKLRQKFTTDVAERELIVDMTLTNLTTVTLRDLYVIRISDLNVENTTVNRWETHLHGVWASGLVMGVSGRSLRSGVAYSPTRASAFTCAPTPRSGPFTDDGIGATSFQTLSLGPGKSQTYRVTYRRY